MKKKAICTFTIVIAVLCCLSCSIHGLAVDTPKSYPFEGTQDEIQKDALIALVYPKINEALDDYYKKYFNDLPGTAPYFIDLLSIDAEKLYPNSVNPFSYIVKVQVSPYLGPHISVGTDQITLRISLIGEVKVEKFEHIKSYELPWNYKDSIKNEWPPKD